MLLQPHLPFLLICKFPVNIYLSFLSLLLYKMQKMKIYIEVPSRFPVVSPGKGEAFPTALY